MKVASQRLKTTERPSKTIEKRAKLMEKRLSIFIPFLSKHNKLRKSGLPVQRNKTGYDDGHGCGPRR